MRRRVEKHDLLRLNKLLLNRGLRDWKKDFWGFALAVRNILPELPLAKMIFKMKMDYLLLQIEQHEQTEKDIVAEIASCAEELKLLRLKNKRANLTFDIKEAQQAKDKNKLEKLL